MSTRGRADNIVGVVMLAAIGMFVCIHEFNRQAEATTYEQTIRTVRTAQFYGISDATGTIRDRTTTTYSGQIVGIVIEPSTGAAQPTQHFDVSLTDDYGYNLMGDAGVNCASGEIKYVTASNYEHRAVDGRITCAIANAGSAKAATVTVYIR